LKKKNRKGRLKTSLIFLSLLFLVPGLNAEEDAFRIRVVADQANIRLSPDIGSIIIKQVPKGTILESQGKSGEWYRVRLTEKDKPADGFVHESLVTLMEPSVLPEQETEREVSFQPEKSEEPVPSVPPPPPPPPKPSRPSGPRFDIRIKGGGIYTNGGDINRGAQGFESYIREDREIPGEGEVKAAHIGTILGGEFGFQFLPNLYLYAGADQFLVKKESHVELQDEPSPLFLTTRPEIKAFPIHISLAYYLGSHLYVKAGISYYFASCTYYYRIQEGNSWYEWRGESDARKFGTLVGLGLERNLSSHLRFFLEGMWRNAKIEGFEGKNTYTESPGSVSTEEGTLYFYQAEGSENKSHPLLFIRERKPSEPGVVDPNSAVIDFSGWSLIAGIRLRF